MHTWWQHAYTNHSIIDGPALFRPLFFPFAVNLNTLQLFLLRLIDHIQNKDAEQWKGVFYICILFVSNIVWTLSCHMSLHNSVIVGIQMRSSVVSVLYRKSLKISNKARAQFTIGEITNYMRYVNTGNSLIAPLCTYKRINFSFS